MKNKKTLIIVIAIVVLLVGGILLLFLLNKDDNKPNPNGNTTNTTNNTTLGEEQGYYELKENTNDAIYENVCNEEVCVIVNSISFFGDNGGVVLNIHPNEQFNKEQNQSGYIKLKFNNTCPDNIIIADYDFNVSKSIEKEIQTTCIDFLNTEKFFISTPTEEELNEYSLKHVHED